MLSEREYVHILDKWLEGVPSEVKFWNTYMASRGATGSHNWEEVISADRPFRLEEDLEKAATRFLDAGSGPFSRCGFKTSRTALSFVAVDALAPAYARLKQMYGIVSGMQPQFGFTEILSDIFPPESFDIVHMSNSLDHCIDPVLGLYNLFHVCAQGGKVILRHAKNEGASAHYDGLHQWNLCVEKGRFVIWRGDLRVDIAEMLGDCAEMETFEDIFEFPEKKWKYDKVVIRKRAPVEIPQSAFRRVCFEKLVTAVYDRAFEDMSADVLAQRCAQYEKEIAAYKQRLDRFVKRYEALAEEKRQGA